MIIIAVILLVAFIITPLLDLTLKLQPLYIAKILIYVITLAWVLYVFFAQRNLL
jgi:hypothetical protein